jgi:amino acid adenylation domain-containing protein
MPAVSVIMPLYNKAAYVKRALDSVLAQSWQDFEVVVVDDGSTDSGPDVVKSYKDDRIRLIQQSNAGPGAARNRGVRESTSPYIAFLDGDDEYLPDFLRKSLCNIMSHPDCALTVANHYRGIDKALATTVFPFDIGIETGPWRLPPDSEARVVWGSLIFLQSWVVVCRREIFVEYGGFYEHHCTYGEDQYLWLQVLLNCRMYRDTTPLFWYHIEDSDLEIWKRVSATPIWPFLSDPEPIRGKCPPEYRSALEKMLPYSASLNFSYMITDESVTSFWREQLRGIPDSHGIPLDHPRTSGNSGMEARQTFTINGAASEKIRASCAARSISPEQFFLAVLAFLVWKNSGQETIVIGTRYATRRQEEIQGLYGCFINEVPVRFDMDGDSEVSAWLADTQARFSAAWSHTSIGNAELVDLCGIPRAANINPIFQIGFGFRGKEYEDCSAASLQVTARGLAGLDLSLDIRDAGGFDGTFTYSPRLLDSDNIEAFAANYTRIARALAEEADARLDRVGLLDERGLELIARTNMTERPDFLGRTFLDMFRESLGLYRDEIAVKSGDGAKLTYGELDALSDAIAGRLITEGAGSGQRIGLYLLRDRWLLPSLLGIFKSGGAYVPLDPHFPRDRLAGIIDEAGMRIVLTVSSLEAEVAALGTGARALCADACVPPALGVELPGARSEGTAYILFTSGSTGTPKGVPIRHEALANLLLSMREEPGISREDYVLGLTTFTFDISTLEFFLPLICGAKLLVVDYETSLDNARLVSLIEEERVTFIQATPSRWSLLLEAGLKGRVGMTFLTGGEAIQRALANTLAETGASIWNMYGPTETTVWSSLYRLQPGESAPYIGKPIANTGFFILDVAGHPLPAGLPGELGISGSGLSEGYLNRPDLTAGRFVEVEVDGTRRRVYKTGDLALQRPSGNFECLGRNDFQVKIRGFRIELGEIESRMLGFPGIREAICSVWERTEQDKRIVAYYRSDTNIDEIALKAHLRKSLPDYMVPGHFMVVDSFPRTSSGKTDRKALPKPEPSPEAATARVPANALEERILMIWREVLGMDSIGIDDNFFDLGGHSILAVELIGKMNARIGGNWKLRDLFEKPTAEGLVGLFGLSGKTKMPLLFPAARQGKGIPLFLVAGVYNSRYFEDESRSQYEDDFLRYFNNILLVLGKERPVYGLRPKGIYFGERFHSSVEAMAEEYIREIKSIQPRGPYLIGGECLGGAVAHAIACRLSAQGDTISKLILLDTCRVWMGSETIMRSQDLLRDAWSKILDLYRNIFCAEFSGKEIRNILKRRQILLFPLTKDHRHRRNLELGSRKYARLLLRYRPKRYDGKTLLIINEEWNARHPSLHWDSTLCPHLDIRVVPGNHMTRLMGKNSALESVLREGLS